MNVSPSTHVKNDFHKITIFKITSHNDFGTTKQSYSQAQVLHRNTSAESSSWVENKNSKYQYDKFMYYDIIFERFSVTASHHWSSKLS